MLDKEVILKSIEEQKIERQHQIDFIKRLESTYDDLSKKGFQPLDPLLQQIATWRQNLSVVEEQINSLEDLLKIS